MNYSMNMYNRHETQLTEIQNSIFIGGPKHLEIINGGDGSDVLRCHELPELPVRNYHHSAHIYDEFVINVHDYYRVEIILGSFKGHVYVHQNINRDYQNSWIQEHARSLIDRIRYDYDNRDYRFFNVPYERVSADDNGDSLMEYAPYIPIEYNEFPYISDVETPWRPPAGWDKGKLKKETKKLQLKLDDKLFEL